jgi:cytochrome c oxidase subunit II
MRNLFLSSLVIATLFLAGCSSETNSTNSTDATKVVSYPTTTDLVVTAKNFAFDQPEYHVKASKTLKVTLKIEEGMHGIYIPDLNVTMNEAGDTTIDASKPGTYEIVCSVPCGTGHLNMKAKLVVES